MPTLKGAKTSKHKTRNHSNLRPKHRQTKDFLKVYYPYLPLVSILVIIFSILQPWQAIVSRSQDVLPYSTQMSVSGLVESTNSRRLANHEETLKLNAQLTKAAQIKAQDMVARNYWSHNTPDGHAPWEFINDAGYSYKKAGENLAYGFDDENGVISGWMNSPGHRANMLDVNYREVGFGFAESSDYLKTGPTTVVVAMYGQPSGAQDLVTDVASTDASSGYNTLGVSDEPSDSAISRLQTWVDAPNWVNLLGAAIAGGLLVYLLVKYSRQLRKVWKRGERFVLHHPLLDATLVALVILVVLVCQQSGIIR